MNPNREELLFQLALTKPAAERRAWLDRECGDDKALRARLDALLAAHEQPETLLLYTANMNLAQQAWDQNNVGRLGELLNETRESAGRGFEWYYWQRQAHLELKTLRGHLREVTSVAFSPDGQRIVTGSWDQTAKVWEAATPQQVAAWQAEEQAAGQRLAPLRAAAEAEAKAVAQEFAALAGPSESAPKHQPSARERPLQPGDPGVIRQWLMLAPLPFRGDLRLNTLRQQLTNEARLRPRAGERPPEAPTGLAWTPVRLGEDSYKLDFGSLVKQARPGSGTDNQIAYAVAYIVSEKTQTGLMLLAGSNDTARIYLNEREIYRQLDVRSFRQDSDEVSGVALKAGVNVLVFKVGNEGLDWAGSVRLLDAAGQPVQGIQVTLDPEERK